MIVALVLSLNWFTQAGETFKPGKLSKEEIAKLDPGLTLRFLSADRSLVLDTRRVRLAALHVPPVQATELIASTMLTAGPPPATVSGTPCPFVVPKALPIRSFRPS